LMYQSTLESGAVSVYDETPRRVHTSAKQHEQFSNEVLVCG